MRNGRIRPWDAEIAVATFFFVVAVAVYELGRRGTFESRG